jgi:acyl-CoA reductase-like NAD-dependent aldehyde dehydrogenase
MLVDGAWVGASNDRFAPVESPIRMANDSHYGLSAYVWCRDVTKALRTAHAIESGWVQVNRGLGQFPGLTYGGYKQSGIGREFSLQAMLEGFTQTKSITVSLQAAERRESEGEAP